MLLQLQTKEKINLYCGKNFLLNSLKDLKKICSSSELNIIDNNIIYFGCLFETDVNMTMDLIEHRDFFEKSKELFLIKAKIYNCPVWKFHAELLGGLLNHTENIKKISTA